MTPSGETRRIQLVRHRLTNWENTATPISHKKPPGHVTKTRRMRAGLFFYSPMLHQYSFDPAGMWSSTMRRWQVFFAVTLVDGADDHAAAVDAHHFAWWQVGDGDQGLSNKFLWFVVFVDAGEDGSVFAGSVVEGELEELFALWHGFAIEDFDGAGSRSY